EELRLAGRADRELILAGLGRPEPAAPAKRPVGAAARPDRGATHPAHEAALWRRLARFALAVGAVEVNRAQAGAAAVRVRAEERVVRDRRKRIVVDSLRLDHLDLTAEQIAQRLAERSPGVGHHLRAAAALQLAADGVGPDQRHAADRSVER